MAVAGLKLFIVFMIFCCSLLFTFLPTKEPKKPSELLQLVLDDTLFFENTKDKLQIFTQETTFDELVEKSVKPALDKIASVRKELEIYEKLERIPGGPQNFMTTSTITLDEIYKQQLEWQKKYQLATLRIEKRWPILLDLAEVVDLKIKFLISEDFFEPLNKFQIHFQPMQYEDDERKLQQQHAYETPLPMSIVLETIKTELLPFIKRFEAVKLKLGEPPEFDFKRDVENGDPKLIAVLTDLVPHIRMYVGHYNKLGEYWSQLLGEIKKITDTAMDKAEKSKRKFEEFAKNIDKEIIQLKERIRLLKGPKQNIEL